MNSHVRILHLESKDDEALLVSKMLKTTAAGAVIVRVATPSAYRHALTQAPFDLILSNYSLPGLTGLEALQRAQQYMPDATFIFITGAMENETEIDIPLLGAAGHVKHRPRPLIAAIKRVVAEAQLKRDGIATLLQRFQVNILATVTDGVIVVSAEGQITYWNDGAVKIFNLSPGIVMGKPIALLDVHTKRGMFPKLIAKAFKNGDTTKEIPCQTSDGRKIWVLVKATPMKADADNHIACLLIAKDISERKMLEEEREKSDAKLRKFDKFKAEFLATASHEMRTPLTIIREFASLMSDGLAGPVSDGQSKCLLAVLRNCDRMTSLLNDLLDLAKIESGKMFLQREKTNITELLAECTEDFLPYFGAKSQAILQEIEENLPPVLGDRSKIVQALVNLVSNANKFTPEGGSIVVRAFRQQKHVCIEISDTGQGIDEADLLVIFDAFVQAGREEGPGARGTGLGLTITRQIVQLHDGEISIKSEKGAGSTFSFTLPIYSVELEQAAFVLDRTREVGVPKGRPSVIAVAVRGLDGSIPERDALLRAKASCDKAMPDAKACESISESGVIVYAVEAGASIVKADIKKLIASAPDCGVILGVECEEIQPNSSVESLEVALVRLRRRAA